MISASVPALSSFNDGLWPGSSRRINPFLPQVMSTGYSFRVMQTRLIQDLWLTSWKRTYRELSPFNILSMNFPGSCANLYLIYDCTEDMLNFCQYLLGRNAIDPSFSSVSLIRDCRVLDCPCDGNRYSLIFMCMYMHVGMCMFANVYACAYI